MSIDGSIRDILRDAERLFDGPGFEGTPEQYAWIAAKLGISAADDLKWRFVIDPEADDKLDPENPGDGDLIDFLSDDDAVERFLVALSRKYRAALEKAPSASTVAKAPRPVHSAAFVAVRNRLLALSDDADRAALARLFGAIGAPEADPSTAMIELVRAIATLDDADAIKLARWCRTYVTKSGQVPQATVRPAG